MGERKGQNHYYPPDFDPKKHFSLNSYHGVHALRERAKKIKQGILIIRFEMPFNVWCLTCNEHIGMGVRYDAEKSKVGYYHSTPIWLFRFKCYLCQGWIEIKTDPANQEYVCVSGARRKEQRWRAEDNEQIVCTDRETAKKLSLDAMFKLEHGIVDKKTAAEQSGKVIGQLENVTLRMRDDYDMNCMLRRSAREERNALKRYNDEANDLKRRTGLERILPEAAEDRHMAALVKYGAESRLTFEDKQRRKRSDISERPLFTPISSTLSAPSSSTSSSKGTSSDATSSATGRVSPAPSDVTNAGDQGGASHDSEFVDLSLPDAPIVDLKTVKKPTRLSFGRLGRPERPKPPPPPAQPQKAPENTVKVTPVAPAIEATSTVALSNEESSVDSAESDLTPDQLSTLRTKQRLVKQLAAQTRPPTSFDDILLQTSKPSSIVAAKRPMPADWSGRSLGIVRRKTAKVSSGIEKAGSSEESRDSTKSDVASGVLPGIPLGYSSSDSD